MTTFERQRNENRIFGRLKEWSEFIKFEHSVFALPFALSSLLLASPNHWPPLETVGWVILAMISGRTYAMAMNRLLDATIDAKNPRTQNRSLPAGRMSQWEAWGLTLSAALGLCVATYQLPALCQTLLPVAFFILTVYSLFKRFSPLAHLVLGVALGSSSVGAWIALTGVWSGWAVLFALAVMFWVAGFDVIYACQDEDFDRKHHLHSIPVWLGRGRALQVSQLFHGLMLLCLIAFGTGYPHTVGMFYWLGLLFLSWKLVQQHALVSLSSLEKVNEAFFVVNGQISVLFFVMILLDKAL